MTLQTVLVTSTGSIIAQGIIKSLNLANREKDSSAQYHIIGADMSPDAPGLYRADDGILIPPASATNYIDYLTKLCKQREIKAIFVGSDEELITVARAQTQIERESETRALVGPIDLISKARDKWKTFEFCKINNLPHAASALPSEREEFAREFGFPLVVKPREGYGSVHFNIAKNRNEMDFSIQAIEHAGWHAVLQEFISGEEFTTGITMDTSGKKIMSSIAIKKIIKHGQTYKAFVGDFAPIRASAEEFARKFGATGPINVQAKLQGDRPVIFEVNPRFSASCPIRAVAGVNEPDIVFRNTVQKEDLTIDTHRNVFCMRYWNEVYIPMSTYEETNVKGETRKAENHSSIEDYF
ncbi:MAG: ATP-grasp domain-containing protein [Thermoproteota archaeon]|nr:ATP-grasp domain-containing protein [Thermoproteota archaeon]